MSEMKSGAAEGLLRDVKPANPNITDEESRQSAIETEYNCPQIFDEDNYAKVLKAATELFGGDSEAAQRWMEHPVRGLGEKGPVDMLSTQADTDIVLTLIAQLEHGIII